MPNRPLKPCADPTCRVKVASHLRFCKAHMSRYTRVRAQRNRGVHKVYNSQRWRALQRQVMEEEPTCRVCGKETKEVDHIIPDRLGGPTTRENLQGLCRLHHRQKTAAQRGA